MACVSNATNPMPGLPSRALPSGLKIETLIEALKKGCSNEYEDLLDGLDNSVMDSSPRGKLIGGGTFVARSSNGQYLGTASIEIRRSHSGNRFGHITDVIVKEEYRGLGIGSMLMQHLIKIAKQYRCPTVDLMCEEHNIPFYTRLGFSPHGGYRMVIEL